MPESLQLFLIIVISIVFGGAVFALLLFMAVFPAINRLFGTRLPAYRYGEREDRLLEEEERQEPDSEPKQKAKPSKPSPKAAPKSVPKPEPKSAAKAAKPAKTEAKPEKSAPRPAPKAETKPDKSAPKSAPKPSKPAKTEAKPVADEKKPAADIAADAQKKEAARARLADFHKDVPTVRVDTLFIGAGAEKPLTAAKIDAEGKRATKVETGGAGLAVPATESKRPALKSAPLKPAPAKKPSEGAAAEPETVEIPSAAPKQKNKK